MMFLLNELSLHNQYRTESDFIESLKIVLGCRDLLRIYQRTLHCGRGSLGSRQVADETPFRKIIGNVADKNIQRAILQWIDKDGPFWDDDRLHSSDEYFDDNKGEPVTDTVLAEAAFRVFEKMDSSVVSFAPSDYLFSPVIIKWHHHSSDILDIHISNYWQIQLLRDLLIQLQPPIQSWVELTGYAKSHFDKLVFLPSFELELKSQPFNNAIADQAIRLLGIINDLKSCFDELGERTAKGNEIILSYFTGENAKFSDESITNKNRFKKELTFKRDDGVDLFCPYHGKISYRYYRLHMSWPVTKNDPLYIAYLGPKITKG